MHKHFVLTLPVWSTLLIGCATEDPAQLGTREAAIGSCGLGDDVIATERLHPDAIPSLSSLRVAQIIAAVHESAHTDVTTIEEAFARVDDHEIDVITLHDDVSNQFYTEIEFGAGDNSYGAIFYWGVAVEAAAIHDGFQEECGPVVFDYDRGDVADACGGFLAYTNTASFAALDAYLPSNVAQALVDTRAVKPFDSIASVMAVSGVGETRLQQLYTAASAAGLVGASCSGIYDQLAVSTTEDRAMVSFVDEISRNELHGTLAFLINQTVVDTLLATRPYASTAAISATSGVGPATLRALRNAATYDRPWEELVGAVDAIDHPDGQIRIDLHFDWVPLVTGAGEHTTAMTCFGIDPALLPPGATSRATLADGNEVMENAGEAVSLADHLGELAIDPAAGLTDLDFRTRNDHFLGCYIDSQPNPWVFDRQAFFVNTRTGASLLVTSHYVE